VPDFEFNIAKSRAIELINRVKSGDPAASRLYVMLLTVAETQGLVQDYDTFAAILAGSNTEFAGAGYARVVLAAADLAALSPDDTNNWFQTLIALIDFSGNTDSGTMIVSGVLGYAPTATPADSAIVPILHFDVGQNTAGAAIQITNLGVRGV
jgi:hypothetical protein